MVEALPHECIPCPECGISCGVECLCGKQLCEYGYFPHEADGGVAYIIWQDNVPPTPVMICDLHLAERKRSMAHSPYPYKRIVREAEIAAECLGS